MADFKSRSRRRNRDPGSPEVMEAVAKRIRSMTREELLERLAWYPEGVPQTWRLAKDPEIMFPKDATDSLGRVVGPNPGWAETAQAERERGKAESQEQTRRNNRKRAAG